MTEKDFKGKFIIRRMPKKDHEKLRYLAYKTGKSMQTLVLEAIHKFVKEAKP